MEAESALIFVACGRVGRSIGALLPSLGLRGRLDFAPLPPAPGDAVPCASVSSEGSLGVSAGRRAARVHRPGSSVGGAGNSERASRPRAWGRRAPRTRRAWHPRVPPRSIGSGGDRGCCRSTFDHAHSYPAAHVQAEAHNPPVLLMRVCVQRAQDVMVVLVSGVSCAMCVCVCVPPFSSGWRDPLPPAGGHPARQPGAPFSWPRGPLHHHRDVHRLGPGIAAPESGRPPVGGAGAEAPELQQAVVQQGAVCAHAAGPSRESFVLVHCPSHLFRGIRWSLQRLRVKGCGAPPRAAAAALQGRAETRRRGRRCVAMRPLWARAAGTSTQRPAPQCRASAATERLRDAPFEVSEWAWRSGRQHRWPRDLADRRVVVRWREPAKLDRWIRRARGNRCSRPGGSGPKIANTRGCQEPEKRSTCTVLPRLPVWKPRAHVCVGGTRRWRRACTAEEARSPLPWGSPPVGSSRRIPLDVELGLLGRRPEAGSSSFCARPTGGFGTLKVAFLTRICVSGAKCCQSPSRERPCRNGRQSHCCGSSVRSWGMAPTICRRGRSQPASRELQLARASCVDTPPERSRVSGSVVAFLSGVCSARFALCVFGLCPHAALAGSSSPLVGNMLRQCVCVTSFTGPLSLRMYWQRAVTSSKASLGKDGLAGQDLQMRLRDQPMLCSD